MKKVLVMLGVMLFSASAFAMNQEAMNGKTCEEEKAAFEKYATNQRTDFVVQNILINMADPMIHMTDEQAQPLATCYATYKVKGRDFTAFVRDNAGIFPGDIKGKEKAELLAFADRVDFLSEKAELDRVVAQGNESFIVQHILGNMIDPMEKMTDAQAAPKAKVYAALKVKGMALTEFVRAHSNDYTMDVEIEMESFANRVERLAK
ncbi:MAG: hypothetical protein IJ266_01185 [Elusimicrobiaceae bacterium]|nr:hypothetical protein [Elusimicrobiaceae bacterium]